MNTKIFITGLVVLWLANSLCLADRQLERAEILNILKTLTAAPHKTWIPAGTIAATHEEYRAAATKDSNTITAKTNLLNEYRMTTNVTVRFSGEKFYWQIDVVSRTDSSRPDSNNVTTEQFDLNANGSRIFAWDGQKYSTYFRPGNHAIVKDAEKVKAPRVVNGPLTAGFIPWGYGHYSYDKLSAATSTAIETAGEDQKQLQLTLNHPNGSLMVFVMDPNKECAVLSHSVKKPDNSISVSAYGNFLHLGGKWIPTTIMLEQYKDFVTPQNLAASDLWNFTSINDNLPADDSFEIDYETDAIVEYHAALEAKPVIYRYSKPVQAPDTVDSDSLVIDKLDIDAAATSLSQNCATAAIQYAASKLGKNVNGQQLAYLVQSTGTSLYAMKQFVQGAGLYCRAVKTDLQTLKGLSNCQAILHIPGKNHYVVFGNMDDNYVRVVDLTSRKFFDRFSINEFGEEWGNGTALMISSQPISGQLVDIDDSALQNIIGTGYSCSKLLQPEGTFYCSAQIAGTCGGTYSEYFERWGCAAAPSGTCRTSMMIKYAELPCIVDPYDPINCGTTGEWTIYYMRACQ